METPPTEEMLVDELREVCTCSNFCAFPGLTEAAKSLASTTEYERTVTVKAMLLSVTAVPGSCSDIAGRLNASSSRTYTVFFLRAGQACKGVFLCVTNIGHCTLERRKVSSIISRPEGRTVRMLYRPIQQLRMPV